MAKQQYRAEVKGKTVWSGSGSDGSIKNFPEEYRGRPADGDPPVELYIDDVLVGVQKSEADEKAGN